MTFREYQKQEFGYDCITTFWEDFTIAEFFGLEAIQDTYNRAFEEWKGNYKYLTELVIVLNHKCNLLFRANKFAASKLYSDLYWEAHSYAKQNLKGEEYAYYFRITD
jgi:hypothetical protein